MLTNFFINLENKRIDKKYAQHFDRLKKSKTRFEEYLKLDVSERIRHYEMIRKAIFRIQDILSLIDFVDYNKEDLLNGDCLYADVHIVPYLNAKHEICFIKVTDLDNIYPPKGKYEIIDESVGKYIKDESEYISEWLAVDYSLRNMCYRWLSEIPAIEHAITRAKEYEQVESQ